jgi:hypothetical protein
MSSWSNFPTIQSLKRQIVQIGHMSRVIWRLFASGPLWQVQSVHFYAESRQYFTEQ